jgi:hypothetical protein
MARQTCQSTLRLYRDPKPDDVEIRMRIGKTA